MIQTLCLALFLHLYVTFSFPGQTRFFPNTRYIYRYVATSLTGVTGTTNEITGLRIEAKCEIEASYSCQRILRVCMFSALLVQSLMLFLSDYFFFRYFNSWVVRASGNLIPLRGGMQRYSALGAKPFPLMYDF